METPLGSLNEEEIAHIFEKIEPFLPVNDYDASPSYNYDPYSQTYFDSQISDASTVQSASISSIQIMVSLMLSSFGR